MLTISSAGERRTFRAESKKSYFTRSGRAVKNLEIGRSVSLSEAELDTLVLERLKG